MGDRTVWGLLVALILVVTACSDSTPVPTLATGTTAPVTTASTPITAPTTTSTTTTTAPPTTTTTEHPNARLVEIQRLAKETFVGRLKAIYDNDKEALLTWVGTQRSYDTAARAIDGGTVQFVVEPSDETLQLTVNEIVVDRSDCIAALVNVDGTSVDAPPRDEIYVWFPRDGSLLLASQWEVGTPIQQIIEDCDLLIRGIEP